MISVVNESNMGEMVETDCGLEEVDVSAERSLNATSGGINISTFKVLGQTRNRSFIIVIDFDATHNFIEPTITTKLGYDLEDASTMIVTIANGEKAFSKKHCKDFRWKMQKQKFSTSLRVLPLGGCDVVLSMQWLKTLGPIQVDFKEKVMSLTWNKQVINIKEISDSGKFREITAKSFQKYITKKSKFIMGTIEDDELRSCERDLLHKNLAIT